MFQKAIFSFSPDGKKLIISANYYDKFNSENDKHSLMFFDIPDDNIEALFDELQEDNTSAYQKCKKIENEERLIGCRNLRFDQ